MTGRLIRDNQRDDAGTQARSIEDVAAELREAADGDEATLALINRAVSKLVENPAAKNAEIVYDDQYGHVCTCTRAVEYDGEGYPLAPSYLPTVAVDRDIEPTESGSYFYRCSRCGHGAWSGA